MNDLSEWKLIAVAVALAVGLTVPALSAVRKEVKGPRNGSCEIHCAPPKNRSCSISCQGAPKPVPHCWCANSVSDEAAYCRCRAS
jgi:hypothetical protein